MIVSQQIVRAGLAIVSLLCLIPTWQVFGHASQTKLHEMFSASTANISAGKASVIETPQSHPLATKPFLQASLDPDLDIKSRIEFAEFGLERNPRDIALWMVRAEMALLQGDWAKAVFCLDRLYLLDTSRSDLYLELLLSISKNSAGLHAIADFLTSDTVWARKLVRLMANTGSTSDELLVISPKVSGSVQPLLNAFVRQGEYERAFLVWLDALGTEDQTFSGWPFNPNFKQTKVAHPFNWQLSPHAEYDAIEGLYIRYEGTHKPRLVSQAMLLGPGTYTLTIDAELRRSAQGGHMRWRLSCLTEAKNILLEFDPTPSEDTPSSNEFTVPNSNCPIQKLSLSGVAGKYPQLSRMMVHSIGIESTAMTGPGE